MTRALSGSASTPSTSAAGLAWARTRFPCLFFAFNAHHAVTIGTLRPSIRGGGGTINSDFGTDARPDHGDHILVTARERPALRLLPSKSIELPGLRPPRSTSAKRKRFQMVTTSPRQSAGTTNHAPSGSWPQAAIAIATNASTIDLLFQAGLRAGGCRSASSRPYRRTRTWPQSRRPMQSRHPRPDE
jgi:hypothetical protein